MKKQILFLAIFTLAVFLAGTTKSFGQDINYITPTTCAPVTSLPCVTNDHLHPIPGQTYTYTIATTPTVGTIGNIQWFVYNTTDNPDQLINAVGGGVSASSALAEPDGGTSLYLLNAEDAAYNKATGNVDHSIDISWQSFNGATKEIILVAYVKGENGCNDNIEVWRIEPTFAFTLDIAGLMPDGTLNYGTAPNANECVTPVQSASYDGTNLTMDYGENYVYFTVTAANFVHSWQPTFTLTNNTQTTINAATDITWAYPAQAILNAAGAATGTWNAVTAPVLAQSSSNAVGSAGECIIVRVRLDHNAAENDGLAARNIILGVDGIMYNVTGANYTTPALQDLDPVATAPCTNTVTDRAQYDLTPRPAIVEVAPAPTSFEPKN